MNALALVMGNNEYPLQQHKLANAVNDANSISDKLARLGFDVIQSNNCDRAEFFRVASEFASRLSGYEIGLFYFSGHGLQIEGIILPEFKTRELVNNFRNLTISNEKTDTQKIRSSLQSQGCS